MQSDQDFARDKLLSAMKNLRLTLLEHGEDVYPDDAQRGCEPEGDAAQHSDSRREQKNVCVHGDRKVDRISTGVQHRDQGSGEPPGKEQAGGGTERGQQNAFGK